MKPDDIPEDVWKTAIRCAEVVCRNLPENYGDMTIEVRAIARAILAERERAAGIAAPQWKRPCDCDGCSCGNLGDAEMCAAWDAEAAIAAAIRQPREGNGG